MAKKFKKSTLHIKNSRPLTKGSWGRAINDRMNGTAGYVYIVDLGTDHQYKIGMTGNIQKRISNLKSSNLSANVVLAFRMPDARYAEKFLHKAFSQKRIEREIFHLTRGDIYAAEQMLTKIQQRIVS